MADIGRVYWDAAPSQCYAEPKRLAALGLREAQTTPGARRELTQYPHRAAGRARLAEWARPPAGSPRMQHEAVGGLPPAVLVGSGPVAEGLRAMEADIESELTG